ncbi:MAG TPA: site-2 protease family protein [Actinomycetota bacterium]|nr:site-2 protease family protein [Actinomycetota bacterium]
MTIRLGRILGIRVSLHVSWFLILGLVALGSARSYAEADPTLSRPVPMIMGAATALLFFACLLAHELGHALVARRLGIPVRGITLFLLGGLSEISEEISVPGNEFAIALAGPLVSAALGGAFAAAAYATEGPTEAVAASLAVGNVFLAVFNLIPGLPLDGGRLLRAGIWRLTGDRRRATLIGVVIGRLLALALLILGVVVLARGSSAGVWYLLMAWFLDQAARAAGRRRPARPDGVALPRDADPSTNAEPPPETSSG